MSHSDLEMAGDALARDPHGWSGLTYRLGANALEGICAMLRKTMIVLATAAALSAGLIADAFARGGAGDGGDAESRQGQIPC
jgi:hypothetical protein